MKITLTAGDTATFNLRLKKGASYHDLTGATLETRLLKADGTDLVLDNTKHTIAASQEVAANTGKVSLTIDDSESVFLKIGDNLNILTKVVQSGEPLYFHGKKALKVLKNSVKG